MLKRIGQEIERLQGEANMLRMELKTLDDEFRQICRKIDERRKTLSILEEQEREARNELSLWEDREKARAWLKEKGIEI